MSGSSLGSRFSQPQPPLRSSLANIESGSPGSLEPHIAVSAPEFFRASQHACNWPQRKVLSKFHVMLARGDFSGQESSGVSVESILLNTSDDILHQLVHSVAHDVDLPDASYALASLPALRQFQFTFDSGSQIHLLTLAAATNLFS